MIGQTLYVEWAGAFQPVEVVAETGHDWLATSEDRTIRINKETKSVYGLETFFARAHTAEQVRHIEWMRETRKVLAARVAECYDRGILERIAAMFEDYDRPYDDEDR